MKIYSTLQIGEYHQNQCEDYLYIGELGEDKVVCAVMDGCTMAQDSYFISTLVGKLLRKIVKEIGYKDWYEKKEHSIKIQDYLKQILKNLFTELRDLKNQLMLEDKEMLTTLILLLIDKKVNNGVVLVIGDGMVSVNGEITEFEQDNKPDYIGFHLHEDFEYWYNRQNQKILIDNIKDVSIATDGIFMFSEIVKIIQNDMLDPIEFLVKNTDMQEKEDMLNLKLIRLEHQYGMKPTDDLALIRIIR